MTFDPQFVQAALLAAAIGIPFALLSRSAGKRHRERNSDLQEVERALKKHFDAMEKIISDPDVPDQIKIPMYLVTDSLDQKDFAIAVCDAFTGLDRPSKASFDFKDEVERLRETRPDIATDIDTAMTSAMVILMLRWPETSKRFKHFVVALMINGRQELTAFSKISEVARAKNIRKSAFSERFSAPLMPSF